jgi:CHAT domain-containing protein
LSRAQRAGDQRTEALQAASRAVAVYEDLLPQSTEFAHALLLLSGTQRGMGKFDDERTTLERIEAMLPHLRADPYLIASVANARGIVQSREHELHAANTSFERAARILDDLPFAKSLGSSVMTNRAYVAWDLGDLSAGRQYFTAAVAMEHTARPNSLALARVRIHLGRLLFQAGDLAGAQAQYTQANVIIDKIGSGQPTHAYLLSNWAELDVAMGQIERADMHHRLALEINEKLPRDCYCVGPALRDYALFLSEQGRGAEALPYLERARQLMGSFGQRDIEMLRINVQHAEALRRNGDLPAAARMIEGVAGKIAALAPDSLDHAHALFVTGQIESARKHQTLSRSAFCRAADLLERVDVIGSDSAQSESRFRARYADVYRACMSALVDARQIDAAFAVFERSRARSLLSMWRNTATALAGEPQHAIDRWINHLRLTNEALAAMADPELPAETTRTSQEQLQSLRAQRPAEMAALKQQAPRTARLLLSEAFELADARAALGKRLFVGYSVGEEDTLILTLSAKGAARARRVAVGRKALTHAVERLRAEILRRDPERTAELQLEASWLHERLMAPIARDIANVPGLLVAADGPLHALPFAALRDRDGGHYLAEQYSLTQVESLSALALHRAGHRQPGDWLIVADPELLPGDAGANLPALPGARAEASHAAQASSGQGTLLLAGEASEFRVKRESANARHLHFAVHGLIDDAVPLDSALLLRSGEGEDGALRVRELMAGMQLDADLVVLSSCGSSLGTELRGDGLISLTRAFRYSGGRNVVATLWAIDDLGAEQYMAGFYRAHRAPASVSKAMANVQRQMLNGQTRIAVDGTRRGVGGLTERAKVSLAHPYYWAGFQVYGQD